MSNRLGLLHLPVLVLIVLLALAMGACSTSRAGHRERKATVNDLDSLHRVAQHQDSVDANLYFYEDAFKTYSAAFPKVKRETFMAMARGKDQAFCIFQTNPATTCLDVGDKFAKLGLKEPALDAYQGGLLSEGANGDALNIRIWSSLAQLHFDAKEYASGRTYLDRILAVDPKHRWARKLMDSAPRKTSLN